MCRFDAYSFIVLAAPSLPSNRESAEIFHLLFLRLLSSGPDRSHYVVKGGCNLRFWFGSVRFSEDIELDVHVTSKTTLKNKIDRLLDGGPLKTMLGAKGLLLSGFSAPKQTEVTQRWKVGLTAEHLATPFQTKIEFSRRAAAGGSALEPIDRSLTRRYALPTALGEHYLAPAAIAQKIAALAHRTETQARDIFDLALLFGKLGATPVTLSEAAKQDIARAVERAMGVSFDEFSGQVVAFLEDEHRVLYESRTSWDLLQADVVAQLEDLGR